MKNELKIQNQPRQNRNQKSRQMRCKSLHKRAKFRLMKMNKDQNAVSNIVTSIMMLGIVMTILGMIMTIYVPMWARSKEVSHLDEVEDSFMDLKINIDDQILTNDVGSKLTTRIPLGTSGGPVFGIGRSTGGLEFDSGLSTIVIYQTEDTLNIYGEGGGNLVYRSQNNYYLDQTFVFENGAILVSQSDKTIMKATPDLVVRKDPVTNITTLDLTIITLMGTHRNVGGSDNAMVETILTSDMNAPHEFDWTSSERPYGQNITIKFTTFNPDIWIEYFNETFGDTVTNLVWDPDGNGTLYDGDYYIESRLYQGPDPILDDSTEIYVNIRNIRSLDCEHAVIAINIH